MCPSLRKWELQIWHLVLIWKLIVDEMRSLMIHGFPMIAALKDGTNPVRGRDITPKGSVVLHIFDALSLWNFPIIVSSWSFIALMFAAFFYEFKMTQTATTEGRNHPFAESLSRSFFCRQMLENKDNIDEVWTGSRREREKAKDIVHRKSMASGLGRWSLRKQCRSGMWALFLRGVALGGGPLRLAWLHAVVFNFGLWEIGKLKPRAATQHVVQMGAEWNLCQHRRWYFPYLPSYLETFADASLRLVFQLGIWSGLSKLHYSTSIPTSQNSPSHQDLENVLASPQLPQWYGCLYTLNLSKF